MSTTGTTYDDDPAVTGKAIEHDARELLGQVMGFVAVTVGFAALGAYLGRDLSGAVGLVLFIGAFACIFGLHIAATKGREQLAIGLMFGLGLLLGLAVAPVIADYAQADPSTLWQAAGATAAFVAVLGAYGYATRRDLSSWGRSPGMESQPTRFGVTNGLPDASRSSPACSRGEAVGKFRVKRGIH